ncbi:hypothetical protein J3E68DRAFT_436474 [Trichoderma sp. SZMC 28012]
MTAFNTVAIVGKGNLGSAILTALVNAGFVLTVIGRTVKKPEDLPAGVKSLAVDYTSPADLETAFRGQGVVICTVGTTAQVDQKLLIDAAIKVGVKRYIPCDFGSITTDPRVSKIASYPGLVEIQQYVKSKAEAGQIEYTIFSTGAFTEFLAITGFVLNLEDRSITLWEGGKHPFSSTSLAGIGKAVAGALKKPDATKNRNLFIHEHVVTQAQILDLFKKHGPSDAEWKVTNIENSKTGFDQLSKVAEEDPNPQSIFALILSTIFGGLFSAHYEKVDNELLGLELGSAADLDAVVARASK